MMKVCLLMVCIATSVCTIAQQKFTGNYLGSFNGDQVQLMLNESSKDDISGTMTDSQNQYTVQGVSNAGVFKGKAVENTLGLTFEMEASRSGNTMEVILIIDVFGVKEKMNITFQNVNTKTKNTSLQSDVPLSIKNKTRDPQVVGTWVKESNYSSGYGFNDTYGSMSTKESMVFYSDGQMGDGGSQTVVGGSNYTGQSSSKTNQTATPGWYWWTENKKLFLQITQAGLVNDLELGKYYIENGRMLITGTNGEKLLLTKQ